MIYKNVSKKEIVKYLVAKSNNILLQNSTKSNMLLTLARFIKKCNIENYNNIKSNNNNETEKSYNIGDIGENVVLKYLGLKKENLTHEIKTFCIDTPHILTNEKVKKVYVLSFLNGFKGLYSVSGKECLNIRLSKKYLMNCKSIKKVCDLEALY